MFWSPLAARLAVPSALVAAVGLAGPALAGEFFTGDFSFSDELGGFRLIAATGSGTSDDPVIIVEELSHVGPVTLVIRRHNLQRVEPRPIQALTLVKRIVNRSERVWSSFELELQEILKKPSVYTDGLSFKQFSTSPYDVESDTFTLNDRRFEPYDRITFQGGSVDPGATVSLRLTITDPTPVREFYLLQDPNVVSVELPWRNRSFAELEE